MSVSSGMGELDESGEVGKMAHSLSSGTAISPDIPVLIQSLLLSQLSDVRTGDTLVVTIVPLPDVLGDFDASMALKSGLIIAGGPMCLPRQIFETEVEQFKGSLSPHTGRDKSVEG